MLQTSFASVVCSPAGASEHKDVIDITKRVINIFRVVDFRGTDLYVVTKTKQVSNQTHASSSVNRPAICSKIVIISPRGRSGLYQFSVTMRGCEQSKKAFGSS